MVAVGVGVGFAEGEPTVVKDSNAVDPATLACCRRSSSAASIFWAQNLNFRNGSGALEHARSPTHTSNINTAMKAKIVIITDVQLKLSSVFH